MSARLWIALSALFLVTGVDFGKTEADEPKPVDQRESEETTRLIAAELPLWKLWIGERRDTELTVSPQSLLRWTNPGTGRVYGDLYVWTNRGRPEVVMSLFKAWQPANGFHVELQSLALLPVEGVRDGTAVWQPPPPGLQWRDIPDADAPADTAVQRLVQMRSLASDFTAELTDFRQNESGERQALRRLTQPIYRYPNTAADVQDGAMFAFTLGTDPEVFLLLEARRSVESFRWQYALARMNNDAMIVLHKANEVQAFVRVLQRDPLRDSYVLMRLPESP